MRWVVFALALALPAMLVPAPPAGAQIREFNCVGAEALEDDAFSLTFAMRAAAPGDEARSPLAAATALALAEPSRNICVLGHALPAEGGARTAQRLAAQRARAVAEALAQAGVDAERIRAEARVAGYSRSGATRPARGVTVVVMP
jgi:outer membrane protein OmpA-like peptidoglycan-associated protein